MRQISVQREKITIERDYLMGELKAMKTKMQELTTKYNDQARLLTAVVSHSKNPAVEKSQTMMLDRSMGEHGGQHLSAEDMAREESMRADRIARQVNRSSFMPLGENPPRLFSEQDPTQQP